DGIRDRNVTGVQTCALPISRSVRPRNLLMRAAGATATFTRAKVLLAARLYNETRRTHKQVTRSNGSRLSCGRLARLRKAVGRTRSEERRVGKEWTWTWRRDP